MRQFKKRTIALVLASVITVVGAFGVENYKNSLMSLKFENQGGGSVNMTLHTKRIYERSITPIKKDANTYIIILPETNSELQSKPELAGDIDSVDVRTMPYTTSSKGYTKITIKTVLNTNLNTQNVLYIPEKKTEAPQQALPNLEETNHPVNNTQRENYRNYDYKRIARDGSLHSLNGVEQTAPVDIRQSVKQFESTQRPENKVATNPQDNVVSPTKPKSPAQPEAPAENSSEVMLLILGVFLVLITSLYFFIRGKNKVAEIIGEQIDFDDKEEKSNKQKEVEKKTKIKHTINKLDKIYTKPVKMPINSISDVESQKSAKSIEPISENIVDLDELFQEKTKTKEPIEYEEENKALEEFLSGFSFDEAIGETPKVEETSFDEELYNKFINDENLRFSKDDIEKIEKLLSSEISDDTINNIDSFVVTNPIVTKRPRTEILEDFITAYTINQNISFSRDDVDALNKLISVELDPDFITDLRTNPKRLKEMQDEMAKHKSKPHKTSELLTLNVKDMLPDLSEALRKQGGRRIESEVKPQVVYYSEGYDVSTIALKDQLPDLSVEINNDDAYKSRPSDKIELAVSGYDVAKMSIGNDLPDLEDALKNPEKYKSPEEEPVEVDENQLLASIKNVTFKPFYEEEENTQTNAENAPSVSDIQQEFSEVGDSLEIVNDEEETISTEENTVDDFEALYDNNYVDLDKKGTPKKQIAETQNTSSKPQRKAPSDDAEKLIKMIEVQRIERRKQQAAKQNKAVQSEKPEISGTCTVDGKEYKIIAQTAFSDKLGCYLTKDIDGYKIIGYTGENTSIIKTYETLKSENLQSRVSEKLPDGTIRYIVRLGLTKFVLNVKEDSMEYVIDLC